MVKNNENFGAGVEKLRTAMILYLVGLAVIVIGGILAIVGGVSHVPGIIYWPVLIIGFAIFLLSFFLERKGFAIISSANESYSIGSVGALLQLIGSAIFLAGIVLIAVINLLTIGAAVHSLQQPNGASAGYVALTGTGTMSAIILLVAIFIGGAIIFIGSILAIVGFWRIGASNNSDMIQVGAILYLVVNIIGAILLMIGLDPSNIKK